MLNKNPNEKEVSEIKEAILKAKKSFLMVGFFSFFVNLLMLVSPLYMLQLYDRVLTSRSEDTLIFLTLIVVVLFITMALLEIVRSRVLIYIGNKFSNILSTRVFDAVFTLAHKKPGKASSTLLNDLSQIKQFMTGNGVFALFDAPWMPIYIFILFLFNPLFGYFAIFAALVLTAITFFNSYSTDEKLKESNNLSRESSMYVEANLRNVEVISAMGMTKNIRDRWLDKYNGFLSAQTRASMMAGIWANISKTSRMLFQSLILGLGGYLAIKGDVTSGMMIAGSIILGRALAPLDLLTNSWKGFVSTKTSYERLDALLKEYPKNKEYMELPAPKGELLFENVYVKPPSSDIFSLKEVNLKIEVGDIVGVIGASAAGKSSFARVALGLWPLVSGVVRLDNADIAQWDRELLGSHIGYLPQDIELFAGTVSENISRFQTIDAEAVILAAQEAGVHDLILRLPDGYDTKIGAGGASLSGGQRQRIAFARAIYGSPSLVVLDEPNSNLDEEGEQKLLLAINLLKQKGTTVILITHKLAVLQTTNKLLVLKDGSVDKYGNTSEIMAEINGQKSKKIEAKVRPKISLSKPGS